MLLNTFDLARQLGQTHDLQMVENPFHSSVAVELRLTTQGTIRCLGFIHGPTDIEVYRRALQPSGEHLRDKLWWCAWLLPLKQARSDYQVIGHFTEQELIDGLMEKLVAQEFAFSSGRQH